MSIEIGKKVLITTDQWFFAPNGQQYKAVHGTVKAVKDAVETLGVKTNAKSTNWYVEIGNMTIAGCQIFYATEVEECNFDRAVNEDMDAKDYQEKMLRSKIYNADVEA